MQAVVKLYLAALPLKRVLPKISALTNLFKPRLKLFCPPVYFYIIISCITKRFGIYFYYSLVYNLRYPVTENSVPAHFRIHKQLLNLVIPYVDKLDKKIRTHWAFKRPKSVKMSFFTVLMGSFFSY